MSVPLCKNLVIACNSVHFKLHHFSICHKKILVVQKIILQKIRPFILKLSSAFHLSCVLRTKTYEKTWKVEKDTVSCTSLKMAGRRMEAVKKQAKNNLLVILLVLAIASGVGLGAALRAANLDKREQMYFA